MTKTKDSPPEEDGSGETLDDQSGPMWDELVRLLGDEESGHTIHRREAPGDSGASPGEQPRSYLTPWSNGHPAVGPEPPRGMGWPAGGLQLICKLLLRAKSRWRLLSAQIK